MQRFSGVVSEEEGCGKEGGEEERLNGQAVGINGAGNRGGKIMGGIRGRARYARGRGRAWFCRSI